MWLSVLLAAESWGIPPWEIAAGSRLHWFFRWMALAEQRAKLREELNREQKD